MLEYFISDGGSFATWACLSFGLAIGHIFADYPFQTDYIARAKQPGLRLDWEGEKDWILALFAHCMVHAGMVWLLTGLVWFAVAELILHFIIDGLKNRQITNLWVDQALHYLCKFAYAAIIVYFVLN